MTDSTQRPTRSLDRKLEAITSGRYTPNDFILADAKDADMAFGVPSAGPIGGPASRGGREPDAVGPGLHVTREQYLQHMREMAASGSVDILLTSAANGERLAGEGALGEQVTLAVRGNDTTDIWNPRGHQGSYVAKPSRAFRTVDLASIKPFCDLVLYSVTFNNDLDHDLATAQAYAEFRKEAADLGIRHFLEVFNPNAAVGLDPHQVGGFVNDWILRLLAGVTSAQRPLFFKVAFNGHDALAELVEHDPSVVVGILGGSAGTTRDTFELLHQAEQAGARVALFGRKIQRAESQRDLVDVMRPVLTGELTPEQAVAEYHRRLAAAGITPYRSLEEDQQITERTLKSPGGSSGQSSAGPAGTGYTR